MKKFLVMVLAAMLICMGIVSVSSAEPEIITYYLTNDDGIVEEYNTYQDGAYAYRLLPDETLEIVGFDKNTEVVIIPSENNGRKVTSIGLQVYSSRDDLTTVTIPDTITSIGRNAFSYCRNLREVILPDTLTFIGQYAFRGCSSLESITIPDSVTTIAEGAFSSCENLTDIRISQDHPVYEFSNGVLLNKKDRVLMQYLGRNTGNYEISSEIERIGENAFEDALLSSVVIPDSVTTIGDNAFRFMDNLKEITIPNSVTSIGSMVFYNNKSMTTVRIPAGVTELGGSCFTLCPNLNTIDIDPENPVFEMRGNMLINKQKNSLYYHLDLDYGTFEIPEEITSLENGAFERNKNLTEIIVPDSVTAIGGNAFRNCTELTGIRLPGGLKSIEAYTFERCTSLKSITIPDGVTALSIYTFEGCSNLEEVIIPAGVTQMDPEVFAGCEKLVCKVAEGSYAQEYCEKYGINYVIQ